LNAKLKKFKFSVLVSVKVLFEFVRSFGGVR